MKVVNIDDLGVDGLQKLIDKNPTWVLVTCGSSFVHPIARPINFAVFDSVHLFGFKEFKE